MDADGPASVVKTQYDDFQLAVPMGVLYEKHGVTFSMGTNQRQTIVHPKCV